jgi:IS5 family transposase
LRLSISMKPAVPCRPGRITAASARCSPHPSNPAAARQGGAHARAAALKARGVKARLARRPNKHHRQLPPRLKLYNRLIARRRAAVETTFATWKNRMRFARIRYVGLVKATAQIMLAAIAFNMRRWAAITP